jgi:hypothetical protein
MSFRRGMLNERQDSAMWQRVWLFGLLLTVALGDPGWTSHAVHSIRMGATAEAASAPDTMAALTDTGTAGPLTKAAFRSIWVAEASPSWGQDVHYVAPPPGIAVEEPLLIEVNATDSAGQPLMDALVEVTWELDGQRYQSSGRTNALGRTTTRRLIPLNCRGKRCIVAVRVLKDDLELLAYSAFVPE